MTLRWRSLGSSLLCLLGVGCYPLLDAWSIAREGPVGGLGQLQYSEPVGDWPSGEPPPFGRAVFARFDPVEDVHIWEYLSPEMDHCELGWDYEFPIEILTSGPSEVQLFGKDTRFYNLPQSESEPGRYSVNNLIKDPGVGRFALTSEAGDDWSALDVGVAGVFPEPFQVDSPPLDVSPTWSIGVSSLEVVVSDDVDTQGAYFHAVELAHMRGGDQLEVISCVFSGNEIEVPNLWEHEFSAGDAYILQVSRAYYGRDRLPGDEALELVGMRGVFGRLLAD